MPLIRLLWLHILFRTAGKTAYSMCKATLLVDNDLGWRDVSKDDGQDDAGQQRRPAHRATIHDHEPFNPEGHAGLQTWRVPDARPSSSSWRLLMHRPRT
jgi:hypothetical protein